MVYDWDYCKTNSKCSCLHSSKKKVKYYETKYTKETKVMNKRLKFAEKKVKSNLKFRNCYEEEMKLGKSKYGMYDMKDHWKIEWKEDWKKSSRRNER